MRRLGLLLVLTFVASLAWAQAGGPPKPGPELKRLAYFTGNWSSEGTMQASPFGPAGSFSGKQHLAWFPGNFFLVGTGDSTFAGMGNMKEQTTFGYDTQKKMYTYHAINSMGQEETSWGTVKGADWTWTDEITMNGKTYKNRFELHEDSPTSYAMKFNMSDDGGKTWKTVMEGKATKAAAAAKPAAK